MRLLRLFVLVNAPLVLGIVPVKPACATEMRYEQFRKALTRGAIPAVVIDFAKCQDVKGGGGPSFVGVLRFRAYNLTGAYIASSDTHLFEAADGSMKLEYIRARFKPDDSVELTLKRMNPATYNAESLTSYYRCNLRDGSVLLRVEGS
ncbi:MAG: hypothetical protein KF735_07600 [Chelatococcus sp.]|uniref:VirK family protein n=1 Tax=Chelatococcus sp. TaxID=1953771 RepID=UPI0025C2725F|nr:VirK family protein [Chelatococcus sp.]MBX3537484.1 hypothetical protein [Chelatococcus sp.]